MKSRVCRVVNFSNDGSFIPIECVAGRQAMSGEQRHFNLLSNSAFVFFTRVGRCRPVWDSQGMGRGTPRFAFFCADKGSFTCANMPRNDRVGF